MDAKDYIRYLAVEKQEITKREYEQAKEITVGYVFPFYYDEADGKYYKLSYSKESEPYLVLWREMYLIQQDANKTMNTIKGCMIFFVVVTILAIIVAFAQWLVVSKSLGLY